MPSYRYLGHIEWCACLILSVSIRCTWNLDSYLPCPCSSNPVALYLPRASPDEISNDDFSRLQQKELEGLEKALSDEEGWGRPWPESEPSWYGKVKALVIVEHFKINLTSEFELISWIWCRSSSNAGPQSSNSMTLHGELNFMYFSCIDDICVVITFLLYTWL